VNDALARVSIFRRSTRKAAKAAAMLATQMECNELEAANQAQYVAVQQEIDQLWQQLITNDPDVVLECLATRSKTAERTLHHWVFGTQRPRWRCSRPTQPLCRSDTP
jgi:hypothetical protein